ncbi:MAG: FliM/FliN family flagellar motor switch protein [Deltaproteobacteria bacterium]|nr:FliM/FliN family flagellar motor switch protein [Deltaproteobacteria bacterium]
MAKKLRRFKWSSLPQVTRLQARVVNTLLTHFPQTPFEKGFKDKLRNALEPVLHADVDIWFDGIRVIEPGTFPRLLADPCCCSILGLVPKTDKALIEVDLPSAQLAIDKLLGGTAEGADAHRPLSEIEEGVFSFVLLKALAVVQETFAGERQLGLKLEGLHGNLESLKARFDVDVRLVCLSFKLFIDRRVGVLRMYLPATLIESDFPASWPEDGPAKERLLFSYGDRKELVRLLKAPLCVEVGRLNLAMGDLEGLDSGDIVLVETTDARIGKSDNDTADDDNASILSGQVTCRIGDGAHGTILGNLTLGAEGRYEVTIENIVPAGTPRAMGVLFPDHNGSNGEEGMVQESKRLSAGGVVDERKHAASLREASAQHVKEQRPSSSSQHAVGPEPDLQAQHSDGYEEDDGAPDASAAGLLDDVTVAMVVELGRVMVSAADVMGLRPGQVIELSRAPGEPVDLVVDGKRIGKGELVEIDGELGVRILSLAR